MKTFQKQKLLQKKKNLEMREKIVCKDVPVI